MADKEKVETDIKANLTYDKAKLVMEAIEQYTSQIVSFDYAFDTSSNLSHKACPTLTIKLRGGHPTQLRKFGLKLQTIIQQAIQDNQLDREG